MKVWAVRSAWPKKGMCKVRARSPSSTRPSTLLPMKTLVRRGCNAAPLAFPPNAKPFTCIHFPHASNPNVSADTY
eukprot:2264570-Prymnesium_polylepis.1